MMNRKQTRWALVALVGTALIAAGPATHFTFAAQESPSFKEFSDRVQEYAKVHKEAESSLPPLKQSSDPAQITSRQQQLAKRIQEMRHNAQRGDIFTPAAAQAFALAIKGVLSGPAASPARKTLRSGDPVQGFEVEVNQIYPTGLPVTTVPPSLLMVLPRLPDEVAYRILGSDLLLVDATLNVILDFIPQIIPPAAG